MSLHSDNHHGSNDSSSQDNEGPICPLPPRLKPFAFNGHPFPPHDQIEVMTTITCSSSAILSAEEPSKVRKGSLRPKISFVDFMELKQIRNKRKISL